MRASCTLSSLSMNQCGTRSTLLCHQLIPLGDKKAATAPHIISCLYQVQRQDRAGRVFSFILPPLTSSADFFSGLENSQPLVVREAGKVGIWHLQPLLWMVDWFQKKKNNRWRMSISRESRVLPSCFYCCYNCVMEMQPYKLLTLKLSILLSIHSTWWVLQIVMITEGISYFTLYSPHPNPFAW